MLVKAIAGNLHWGGLEPLEALCVMFARELLKGPSLWPMTRL